jgi:DNA-binding Lrp family transcriptional regulator
MDSPFFDLSQNEARVLHSLVKWPELADNEIHSRIGMKKSTFSSIKNRLKENDYFHRFFIPNFPKLGFELSMIMFGQLNRFSTVEERERVAGDLLRSFREDFFQASEGNKTFHLSVSQNYSEYSKNLQQFYRVYSENRFLSKEGLSTIAFPFELSRVKSFLDYESLLSKLFGFASEPYENRKTIATGPTKRVKLTKAQRKVLIGLIKYPDETDTLIADDVGVSRNTVANAKRKFLKQEILLPRVVPNIDKLGMKLLNFTYRKFNPKITMDDRAEASELVRSTLAPHFYVSKNLDGFLISAHANYDEFSQAYDELMRYYTKKEYILDEPVSYQISIPDMHVTRNNIFLDVVTKVLDFNLDDDDDDDEDEDDEDYDEDDE